MLVKLLYRYNVLVHVFERIALKICVEIKKVSFFFLDIRDNDLIVVKSDINKLVGVCRVTRIRKN